MHRALTLLALFAVPGPLAAQDEQPARACDIEIREESDWWQIDHFSSRWTHWLPDRASVSLSAYTYDPHYQHHLIEDGPFSPWGLSSFIVSPQTAKVKGAMWAQLATPDRSLGPVEVTRTDGFYGIAIFKAHEVKDMIGDAQALTVTFYKRGGEVFNRFTVPREVIEAGAGRLAPLYREYQARIDNPDSPCLKGDEGTSLIF